MPEALLAILGTSAVVATWRWQAGIGRWQTHPRVGPAILHCGVSPLSGKRHMPDRSWTVTCRATRSTGRGTLDFAASRGAGRGRPSWFLEQRPMRPSHFMCNLACGRPPASSTFIASWHAWCVRSALGFPYARENVNALCRQPLVNNFWHGLFTDAIALPPRPPHPPALPAPPCRPPALAVCGGWVGCVEQRSACV